MKFASTVVSLFFTATVVEAGLSKVHDEIKLRQDFMRAMNSKPAMAKAGRMSKARKLEKLNESLKKASRKLEYNYGGQYSGQGYNNDGNGDQAQQQQDGQYYGGDYQQQQQQQEMLFDQYGNAYYVGADGFFYDVNGDVVQANEYGLYPWDMNDAFFDMSAKAFKYSGCAAIKTYDVERAYENGNPMVVDTYATFRLCPADKCNPYSISGCGSNYGEYAVDLKTYLSYLLEYYDERYSEYCEYCMPCDYEVQTLAKNTLQGCRASLNEQDFSVMQQMKSQAYENYVAMNGGGNAGNTFYGDNSAYNNGNGFSSYNGQYYNGADSSASFNGQNGDYDEYGNYNGDRRLDQNAEYQQNGQYQQDGQQYQNQFQYNADDGTWEYIGEENYEYNYDTDIYYTCVANLEQMQQYYAQLSQQDNYNGNGNQYADENGNVYQNYQGNGQQNNAAYYDEDGYAANNANKYVDENGQFQFSNAQMEYYFNSLSCCVDGTLCDQCEIANEHTYGKCDSYVCGDYYTHCSDYYGQSQYSESDNEFEISDFLECAPFETEEGEVYYIAPHCGDDHYTISLGVFSDENCVNYIGNNISLKSILGNGYSDSDILKFPKECISCDGVVYADDEEGQQQQQEQAEMNQGVYGEYYTAPTTDEDGNIAMCSTLYEVSAQCNVHMSNYAQVSQMLTTNEKAQESNICTFIENINGGSYDESGEIALRSDDFDLSNWRDANQYKRLKMPFSQAIGLAFSIILCIAVAAVAFVTQREFKRGGNPWKTKLVAPDSASTYEAPSVTMA